MTTKQAEDASLGAELRLLLEVDLTCSPVDTCVTVVLVSLGWVYVTLVCTLGRVVTSVQGWKGRGKSNS